MNHFSSPIYIFMSCDEKFVNYLTVAINSAKYHTSHPLHLFFCARDEQSRSFFEAKLRAFVTYSFTFEIIVLPYSLGYIDLKSRFSIESLFRIFIPQLLPENVERVLYLDVDIIVNSDLYFLYSLPMEKSLGWVEDVLWKSFLTKQIKNNFGLSVEKYVNSWVLLFNLNTIRRLPSFFKKMNDFLCLNFDKLHCVDQDLLNIFFQNEIEYVDSRWNNFIFHGLMVPNLKETYIYHMTHRKADSYLFVNKEVRNKYFFFLWKTAQQGFYNIFFVFFSYPWNLLLRAKDSSVLNTHYYAWFYWLVLFYPPVLAYACFKFISEFKKNRTYHPSVRFLKSFLSNHA